MDPMASQHMEVRNTPTTTVSPWLTNLTEVIRIPNLSEDQGLANHTISQHTMPETIDRYIPYFDQFSVNHLNYSSLTFV